MQTTTTTKEERALRVAELLRIAEALSVESKRLGRKIANLQEQYREQEAA